jgi:hypothetical protein
VSENLLRWIVALGKDPILVDEFRESPESKMAEAGLSEHEKEIIRAGDAHKLRAVMAAGPRKKGRVMAISIGG